MDVRIVPPELDDTPQITALYARTWLATYPNEAHGITREDIKQKTDEMTQPERVARFRANLSREAGNPLRFYRVAKRGERVVGVCGGMEEDEVVHLASLYVLPEEQGQGIGGRLMDAFLAWANPAKPVRVHVVTYNQTAISFYERGGFVDTGKRFTEERYRMASGNRFPEMELVLER